MFTRRSFLAFALLPSLFASLAAPPSASVDTPLKLAAFTPIRLAEATAPKPRVLTPTVPEPLLSGVGYEAHGKVGFNPEHALLAQEIEQLLARMTLEEKAGQLTQLSVQKSPTGPIVSSGSEDDIRTPGVGSLIGAESVQDTRRLQRIAVEESRLHIPLLFSLDVLHGFRTIFPVPLAEAAAWDPDLAQRTARAAAIEASASGVNWTYAPMIDIARDPRWGRVVEGSGEDPFLGSALAVARIRGFHGQGPPATSTLLTTAKHFVGYGAAEGGRDYNTSDLSERTLLETYLPPFHAAVQAGVDAVMPGFNELNGIPMHANSPLLKDTLREQWGFRGIVVSDFAGVLELMPHGVAATPTAAAKLAFDATVDIDMVSGFYVHQLPAMVRNGQLTEHALDTAVTDCVKT